ncbi:UNVERIFIED_CONTAM: hypothetical protein Cloal_3273 [Acetivibrio alkalicellulosi]
MEHMENGIPNTGSKHFYYKHSGAFSPIGIMIILVTGLIGTSILSTIYGFASLYIPFIYINFLLTAGLGFGTGSLIGFGAKIGKLRNTTILTLLSLIFGIFVLYSSWVIWLFVLFERELLLFNPLHIISAIEFLAIEGAWEMFGFVPTGLFLYAIWLLEAIVIIGASVFGARSFLSGVAFCEDCNSWAKYTYVLPPLQHSTNHEFLRNMLEQGNFSVLSELKEADNSAFFTSVQLSGCNECSNFFLLSVTSIENTKDSKGEDKTKATQIIENLIIDKKEFDSIKEWGENSVQANVNLA